MDENYLDTAIERALTLAEKGKWNNAYLALAILAVRVLFAWYASWISKQS